jgi:putative transposase
VVDGSKALSKAIRAVWGDKALIARCRLHKERGILDHLPDAEHDWVRRKLRTAWALTDAEAAKRDLEALARALARKHPGAAGALREGLDETLTVTRLGITGSLLRTVFSTNPVESMIEIVRSLQLRGGCRRRGRGGRVCSSTTRSVEGVYDVLRGGVMVG